MKVLSIPLTLIMFALLIGGASDISTYLGGGAIVQWVAFIGAVSATYRFGRWFVN